MSGVTPPTGDPFDPRNGPVTGVPGGPTPAHAAPPVQRAQAPVGRTGMPAPDAGASAVEPRPPAGYGSERGVSDDRTIGDIVSDLTRNMSTLMRQELALAKAELTDSAKKVGTGAGMFAGAGLAANFMLLFLSLALWWVLATNLIGTYDRPALAWSGLIVAVLWAIVAAVLAMMGKSNIEKVRGLPRTTETVSKIPQAMAGNEERNQ